MLHWYNPPWSSCYACTWIDMTLALLVLMMAQLSSVLIQSFYFVNITYTRKITSSRKNFFLMKNHIRVLYIFHTKYGKFVLDLYSVCSYVLRVNYQQLWIQIMTLMPRERLRIWGRGKCEQKRYSDLCQNMAYTKYKRNRSFKTSRNCTVICRQFTGWMTNLAQAGWRHVLSDIRSFRPYEWKL